MGGWIEYNPERRAMTGVGKDEREMDGEKREGRQEKREILKDKIKGGKNQNKQ